MKRGYVLLETLIVVTLVSVSLLMLYKTFSSMLQNTERNILYDDPSNIYKTYYLKEYLSLHNLNDLLTDKDIKVIDCSNFKNTSCDTLVKELDVNKMYITKYDLKKYSKEDYSTNFNNYVNTLSNKEDFKYRLIIEFNSENDLAYASLGINGEENE